MEGRRSKHLRKIPEGGTTFRLLYMQKFVEWLPSTCRSKRRITVGLWKLNAMFVLFVPVLGAKAVYMVLESP